MALSSDLQRESWKAWRLLTAPLRFAPDFIIAGSPKCATSSVYDLLRLHPRFASSKRKEPTNFIHYPTSLLRSRMNFPLRAEAWRRGPMKAAEASVEYFTHPRAPRDIHALLPSVRLVFLMRDPVKRAWSDYQMFERDRNEQLPFDDLVDRSIRWLENPGDRPLVDASLVTPNTPLRPVYCGLYHENIQRWLAHFPRERCLFLFAEDFARDPHAVMARLFDFVGLPPCELPRSSHARQGGYQAKMSPHAEARLREFYTPHDQRLAEFLGEPLPWTR